MDEYSLIADFHKVGQRQGPGSTEMTLKALSFIPNLANLAKVLDLGCGTGAQTLALAQGTNAHITAVDFLPEFLGILRETICREKLQERIQPIQASMLDLPSRENEFDLIWAEGSIYNMGFAKGMQKLRKFIRLGGCIGVTEISWITGKRPREIEEYWTKNYDEIGTVSQKVAVIEACGYLPLAHFVLPEECWLGNYYCPLEERFEDFAEKHQRSAEVMQFIEREKEEIEMYRRYKDYYSYVFYIAQKK